MVRCPSSIVRGFRPSATDNGHCTFALDQPVVSADVFQLAVSGCAFALAGHWVFGEQHGDQHAALPLNSLAAGDDAHALFAGPHAGRRQDAPADINDAKAAYADRLQARLVTEDGNVDAELSSGVPDRGASRNADGAAVNRESDHWQCVGRRHGKLATSLWRHS